MKKVSLIVPCYNEQDSLPLFYNALTETMNGLNNYEFEVLFVDDGSKDNTLPILMDISNRDSRIKY